jgi:hypothetical protein
MSSLKGQEMSFDEWLRKTNLNENAKIIIKIKWSGRI